LFELKSGSKICKELIPNYKINKIILQKYIGECTCNASDILEAIKDNETLRETLRGPPGSQGRDGKTGAPGLTVSTRDNLINRYM